MLIHPFAYTEQTNIAHKRKENKTMTKREFTNIMKMWEKKNEKDARRARAISIETSIENDIAYEMDIVAFRNAIDNNGMLRTDVISKTMWDI